MKRHRWQLLRISPDPERGADRERDIPQVETVDDRAAQDQLRETVAAQDAGMSTVEYAIGTVVAAAFAAVLYKIVTGGSVISGLTSLINTALHTSL